MTKEVSLTHKERIELTQVLNAANFKNLADMSYAMEDAKAISHDAEETKEINIRLINDGKNIAWDENGKEKLVTISQSTIDAVNDTIKKKEEAGTLTFNDQTLISLAEKLK